MTIGERMRIRRKELHMSADYIANALSVSRSTIFRYEKGDIEKVPTSILEIVAKILNTTPAYLMGWEAKPTTTTLAQITETSAKLEEKRQHVVLNVAMKELAQQKQDNQTSISSLDKYKLQKKQVQELVSLPWYGSASAGTGEFLYDHYQEEIELPAKIVPAEADFCLSVNGHSMEPIFQHGDYIFIEKQSVLFSGALAVVAVNGESFLKRVWFENSYARLESFNNKYEDIIVTTNEDFRIIGKVVM